MHMETSGNTPEKGAHQAGLPAGVLIHDLRATGCECGSRHASPTGDTATIKTQQEQVSGSQRSRSAASRWPLSSGTHYIFYPAPCLTMQALDLTVASRSEAEIVRPDLAQCSGSIGALVTPVNSRAGAECQLYNLQGISTKWLSL